MVKQSLFEHSGPVIIYTDGGSRGNPGPSAAGFIVAGKSYGEYLGVHTNNFAEYQAIVLALKKAKQLLGKAKTKQAEVEVRMDSELACKQLNGQYKILDPDLQLFFIQIWNLKFDFKKIIFTHIPREQNTAADRMVNKALDENV